MRLSLILGIFLVAAAAFMTIYWSQRAGVRVQQQILEMRIKALRNPSAQHAPANDSELQSQEGLEGGPREPNSIKDRGDRIH